MAVTKTFLDDSVSLVADFLSSTGLFNNVTVNGNAITCTDPDNIGVFIIEKTNDYGWRFTANINGGHSYQNEYTRTSLYWGYACINGAILVLSDGGLQDRNFSLLISKTNQNKIAFIIPASFAERNTLHCIAYSDTYPVQEYNISPSVSEQTILSPFITNAAIGTTSYTPSAFYIPYGEYVGRGYAKFIMNGITYLTDGYFAISDVEEE